MGGGHTGYPYCGVIEFNILCKTGRSNPFGTKHIRGDSLFVRTGKYPHNPETVIIINPERMGIPGNE